jgi:hypothetical protein
MPAVATAVAMAEATDLNLDIRLLLDFNGVRAERPTASNRRPDRRIARSSAGLGVRP